MRRALLTAGAVLASLLVSGARGEPLTVTDAIAAALAQNRQIKVDAYGRAIAKAELLQQWGRFDPAVNFQRTYNQSFANAGSGYVIDPISGQLVQTGLQLAFVETDTYALGLSGTTPWGLSYNVGGNAQYERSTLQGLLTPDGYQSFGGVSVTQPLLRNFGFGAGMQGVRVARANRAISEWTYRQTVIDTVTSVVIAFSDLQLAHDNLRIALRSRDLAAGLLAENRKRVRIGSAAQSDVIQAEEQEAEQEESIVIAQRALKDAENALRRLMGQPKFSPDGPDLAYAAMPQPADVTVAAVEDLRRAYDLRPDYRSARLSLEKFHATESNARSLLLPQVDFTGSYGYNGLATTFAVSRRQVEDHDHRGYSAGLIVSVPITFAEGRGRYRSAKLQRQQAEADLQRLEQDIALSVANAAGQIEATQQRIVVSRRAYETGLKALHAEEKKLRAGTSSTLFVEQLQNQLIALEGRMSLALADRRRAAAVYDHEIGATLQRYNITAL